RVRLRKLEEPSPLERHRVRARHAPAGVRPCPSSYRPGPGFPGPCLLCRESFRDRTVAVGSAVRPRTRGPPSTSGLPGVEKGLHTSSRAPPDISRLPSFRGGRGLSHARGGGVVPRGIERPLRVQPPRSPPRHAVSRLHTG